MSVVLPILTGLLRPKPGAGSRRAALLWRLWGLGLALMLMAMLGGCQPDTIVLHAPPRVVRALWQPSSGALPAPTDLVRDRQAQRLALPLDAATSPAEQEFRAWLNTLDGYPAASSLSMPLSGPVRSQGLSRHVIVGDVQTGELVPMEALLEQLMRPEQGPTPAWRMRARPAPGHAFAAGRTYVAGLWGYDSGLVGAAGERVVADAGYYFVRGTSDLTGHLDAMPGDTAAARQATAQSLEAIRQDYQSHFAYFDALGVPREQIATSTAFTITRRPWVWFDPGAGRIPMPSDLVRDPQTGLVDLPQVAGDADERRHILEGLAHYDGFGTSSAVVVEASQVLDPAAMGPDAQGRYPLRLFEEVHAGQWREVQDLERGLSRDQMRAYVRPRLALEPARRHVYTVQRDLRALGGVPLEAQPLGRLLALRHPLVVSGHSALSVLSDTEATRLEPLREQVDGLLRTLEEREGLRREDLAAAIPFRTTSAVGLLQARRAELYRRAVSTEVVNVSILEPERLLRFLMPNIHVIVRGQMTILDHLDPVTGAMGHGPARERLVDFVLTLPRSALAEGSVPVVLFGHGLMTSRELAYLIADPLAEAGFATFSLDLPYHGERTPCLQHSDCVRPASCDALGQCVLPSGDKGELHRAEIPYLAPFLRGTQYEEMMSYPIQSGAAFVNFADLFASRDHVTQAILDLCQALRVMRGADWAQVTRDHGSVHLRDDDVVYVGMSLGGILGASLTAVEPTLQTFALNVPGADFMRIIEQSGVLRPQLERALAERQIAPGSDEHFAFAQLVRWIFDPVDPLNMAQHALREPLEHADPDTGHVFRAPTRRVLIQMVEGDVVVPNAATAILSERMGVPIASYPSTTANHGFLFDPNPLARSARDARRDLVAFLRDRPQP